MAAFIIAIIIAYAVFKAWEDARAHFRSSKAANRKASAGKSKTRRAASAVHHDAGYWASQVLHGFPQARHGFAAGWHAGRQAQAEGNAVRQKAKTEHLEGRARLIPELSEHRRRQQEAMDRIRDSRQPDEPDHPDEPQPAGQPDRPGQQPQQPADPPPASPGQQQPADGPSPDVPAPRPGSPAQPTEGNPPMPPSKQQGDTTYGEEIDELTKIRDDAEDEVNSVRRQRMKNRLDILTSLSLDPQTLSDAADIDDALREQEEAAQKTLEAADTAKTGLEKRHGGIQDAVDGSPVDRPAEPAFYDS
jgi:hypothetical protein